jgi:hypothetical protein
MAIVKPAFTYKVNQAGSTVPAGQFTISIYRNGRWVYDSIMGDNVNALIADSKYRLSSLSYLSDEQYEEISQDPEKEAAEREGIEALNENSVFSKPELPAKEEEIIPEPLAETPVETPSTSSEAKPEYKYNPPVTPTPPKNIDSGQKDKARILNVFSASIILDELSIQQTPGEGSKTQKANDLVSTEYPLIKINDYYLSKDEIDYFTIDSTGKVPEIILSVSFSDELFISKNMPMDGDIISIAIQSKTDVLKPIRNDYVITGVRSTRKKSDGTSVSMTFFGKLFIPGWDAYMGSESTKGTSMEALKKVAKTIGLGFNTNEDNTDDLQIWYSIDTIAEVVDQVTERAWRDEDSFFDWWVDIYYNLNFVNVQKQLLSQENQVDDAALIGNVPNSFWWGNKNDETVGTAKVFSNYVNFRTSSFFITNWRPINNSSKITFEYGTSSYCSFFEHNNILFEDPEAKKYWELEIPPDYDTDKLETHIILRGRTRWDASTGSGESAKANYNYNDIYKRVAWTGTQYTISNPQEENTVWTGNHHKNYMRARVHNLINKVELEKLNVEIEVQGVNLNVIKGDKVPIALIKKDRLEAIKVDEDFQQAEMLDKFYSGWYYVKGFSLTWINQADDILSNFSQSFLLTRREWPTPVATAPRKNENQ